MGSPKKSSAKSEASRLRLVGAASGAFRRRGFSGIGVDGLAESAELTSGAFYFHFRSKLELFIEAVRKGMEELRAGVEQLQAEDRATWLERFTSFYLGYKRTCSLEDGCTLPSLSSEVERAGEDAQTAYEQKLRELVASVEGGLADTSSLTAREQAWALLALLSGGVNMARAVETGALSEEIAGAVAKAACAFEVKST